MIKTLENTHSYMELFSRNIGIISSEEQMILSNAKVTIAGMGGSGGIQAVTLARAGIGNFIIADPEKFQNTDRNRQYGALESTVANFKTEVLGKILKDINPFCNVKKYSEGINEKNVEEMVSNSDAIIDAIEFFNLKDKELLHRTARKFNKIVFTSPILGYSSSLLIFDPNGMSFSEYFSTEDVSQLDPNKLFPVFPDYLDKEALQASREKKRPIPSFAPSAFLSGALLASEMILFLLNKKKPLFVPNAIVVDLFERKYMEYIQKDAEKKTTWKNFWDQFANEAYDLISKLSENIKMLERVSELIGQQEIVLDAGCGTGNLLNLLVKNNKLVCGIDFSDGMRKKAFEKLNGFTNVVIQKGDVCELPYEGYTFNAVASVNVLFNLSDPNRALREFKRVLKNDGVLVISSVMADKGVTEGNQSALLQDAMKCGLTMNDVEKIWAFQKHMHENDGFKFKPNLEQIVEMIKANDFDIQSIEETYFGNNFLIKAKIRK